MAKAAVHAEVVAVPRAAVVGAVVRQTPGRYRATIKTSRDVAVEAVAAKSVGTVFAGQMAARRDSSDKTQATAPPPTAKRRREVDGRMRRRGRRRRCVCTCARARVQECVRVCR